MFDHRIGNATRPLFGGRVALRPSTRPPSPRSPSTVRRWLLAGCLGAIGYVVSSPAVAASLPVGNILPGGGIVHKNIESMRERRFSHLIEQQTDFSCGAASVATILRYGYNMADITEADVLAGLFAVSDPEVVRERGFSLLDIKKYVRSIGLGGRGYRVTVKGLRRIRVPTIVLLNLDGYYHFVVLRQVEGEQVYIADPALGNRVMRLDAFLDAWQNQIVFAVIGPGYSEETVLKQARGALSARELHDIFAPVPSVEDIGFGVLGARLF